MGSAQQVALESAKHLLKSPRLIAHYDGSEKLVLHYDGSEELVLACDASLYRVEAILSHSLDNGEEQPITIAPRMLSTAERQLDKEALAIIARIRKFYQYPSGRFIINTDYKPLMHLFGEHCGIQQSTSARIQRWAITLGSYTYSVQYKPGKELQHADGLSRLPLPDTLKSVPIPLEIIHLVDILNSSPIAISDIKLCTATDPILSKVATLVSRDWKNNIGTGDDLHHI